MVFLHNYFSKIISILFIHPQHVTWFVIKSFLDKMSWTSNRLKFSASYIKNILFVSVKLKLKFQINLLNLYSCQQLLVHLQTLPLLNKFYLRFDRFFHGFLKILVRLIHICSLLWFSGYLLCSLKDVIEPFMFAIC